MSLSSMCFHVLFLSAVCEEIRNYFSNHTKTPMLGIELRSITKGNQASLKSCHMFIPLGTLLFMVDPIFHRDQFEIILEALLEEYAAVVAAVNNKFG